jgi:hypothetical protein
MKKTNKRLILDKQTVRDLTALDAAQVVGGATVNFCPTTFCTIRVCPSRACTLDPSCPM